MQSPVGFALRKVRLQRMLDPLMQVRKGAENPEVCSLVVGTKGNSIVQPCGDDSRTLLILPEISLFEIKRVTNTSNFGQAFLLAHRLIISFLIAFTCALSNLTPFY